jgi:hypothetical protein
MNRAVAAILKLVGTTVCLLKCQQGLQPSVQHALIIFLHACAFHYHDIALQDRSIYVVGMKYNALTCRRMKLASIRL